MCFNTTKLMTGALLLVLSLLSSCGGGSGSGGGGGAALPSLAVPGNVLATAGDVSNDISWAAVSGATSYNIYWSAASGVSKTNGTKIQNAINPYSHTGLTNGTTYYYVVTAVSAGGESVISAQVSATPAASAADPLYADQWHLKNTGQAGAYGWVALSGEDMNVEPAWLKYNGSGIRIAVVDDGLEIAHEDLVANVAPGLSYNYVDSTTDPSYSATAPATDGHGTAVAGIAAARDSNGLGGRGVAPRANLVGYNYIQNQTTANEADAMTRGSPYVHVSINSWGPLDGYGTLDSSTFSWRTAIDYGLANGRGGLGVIYTWSAGNGAVGTCAGCVDNSNYDGYANYHGVIAVASVNDQGRQAVYSESGANLWVSAPGGEYCDTHAITTTDRSGAVGLNPDMTHYPYMDYPNQNYTRCMNGTSAAAPGVAGVAALMLQANPNLGWRDVRLILAQSARKNDAADPGWAISATTPSYHFNHKYGFGVVNAGAAVILAASWLNVPAQKIYMVGATTGLPVAIPDNTGASASNKITVANSGIGSIEFIDITFSSDHPNSGELAITLTSPTGAVSQLAIKHNCNPSCTAYNAWVFGSARHLGEVADGAWTLAVQDQVTGNTGNFQSWSLKFYGH